MPFCQNKLFKFGLVSAVALTAGYGANAQEETETEAVEDARRFGPVVVTAQRREQNLLDVPISVTAVTGDDLEARGVIDITEVAKFSPNVTLEVSRGTNTTLTAFIRGVGQQDPVAGFESGVGIYIDDVYLNRPQGAVLDVFDVERIEVLRGPQGTLYGRNTIGGAVKYVTRRLSDEPTFEIDTKFGSFNQRDVVVKASVPVADTFRIGGAVASLRRDGFGENIVTGEDNYNKDLLAARFAAEWDPIEALSLRLSADFSQDDSNARQGHRLIPGQLSGAPVLGDVFDTRAGLDIVAQEVEAQGYSLVGEYEINDNWTLKNILAYREDESTTPIDFDSLQVDDLDVPAIYENDQFTEELQLLYSSDRLNGLVGVFYMDANASTVFDVVLGPLGTAIGLPGLNAQTFGDVNTETWSIFGDFTFDLTDQVSLAVGGRYTEDERTSQVLRRTFVGGFSDFFGGTGTPIATTSDFMGTATYDDFSPRVSLSYTPTPDHNLYVTYSQGFKGGGFDPRGQSTAAPDADGDGTVSEDEVFDFMNFDSEDVNSFEIGAKSSWFGGRATTSVAVFYTDYTDYQVPASAGVDTDGDGINDTFSGNVENAGELTIQGLEIEASALLGEDILTSGDLFNVNVAAGFLDAEFEEFFLAGADVADIAGLQNTPDTTLSGVFNYQVPVFGGQISSSLTASYRGDTQQFEFAEPLVDQEAFTLIDLSVVWTSDSGRWDIGLYGKNLTDEEYKVAAYDFVDINSATGAIIPTLGLEGTLTAFYGDPRTVAIGVGYRY